MRKNNNHGDFDQKSIEVSRVARVVAGGRRFSFRVASVVGNKKGEVGVGIGKSSDVSSAMEKSFKQGKKNLIKPRLTKDFSISRQVEAKFSSARVLLRPALKGKGLVAGSSVRTVLELAGIKDITAKILSRSKNKINNARAAIKALKMLK
ncbi:MAG: 30S ribosomal protein S5 [Patescibacteria group bacterium]